jgi:hypothetical protein
MLQFGFHPDTDAILALKRSPPRPT